MYPKPADDLLPGLCRITRRRRETHDTVTLWLAVPEPGQWPPSPGQFNMLSLPGIGEVPVSVSGIEEERRLMHTVRSVGAATRAITELDAEMEIGMRGPYGCGWSCMDARGKDVLIVGGGLGLAPLRSLWQAVLEQRDHFGRISILAGARSPEELLFVEELRQLRARFDLSVEVTVDHADSDWRGHVGVVTHLIQRAEFDSDDAVAFLCGPEIMMQFCARELVHAGLDEDDVYLSMERNMQCAVGHCGHCQLGPKLVCCDGPVFSYADIGRWLGLAEA